MRSPSRGTAAAVALLCACGGLDNDVLKRGDVVGRVLRGQKDAGRVVLMGLDPVEAALGDDGSFRLSSVPMGAQELLVVAGPDEALRVPVAVRPAEVTDLSDLDPLPAAFIRIDLTTQGSVQECWVKVHQTDLTEVHAPDGSYQFMVGPLGAGCYDASMEHNGRRFWLGADICLQAGEQRSFDVAW